MLPSIFNPNHTGQYHSMTHNWLTLRRVFVAFFVASFRYTVPSLTWRINTCSRKPGQIEMDKPLFSLCFSLVVVSSFSYEGKDDDLLLTSRNSCGLSAALGDTDKKNWHVTFLLGCPFWRWWGQTCGQLPGKRAAAEKKFKNLPCQATECLAESWHAGLSQLIN